MPFPVNSQWRLELTNYGKPGGANYLWQITSSTDTKFEAQLAGEPDTQLKLTGQIYQDKEKSIGMVVSMPINMWVIHCNGTEETAQSPVYKGNWTQSTSDVMIGMGSFKLSQA